MANTKQYPTITISREYGAGGRSIARGISEKLGIPFYDIDFVAKAAKESGYSIEEIEREGENMSGATKFMNSLLNNAMSYVSSYDEIFKAQKKLILDLAKEDCIIVGRCSNIILKDAALPTFSVFLHSNIENRVARATELNENEGSDIRRYIQRRDSLRATYYKTYTGHDIGDFADYDIALDTGVIGYDQCIDIIVQILEKNKLN